MKTFLSSSPRMSSVKDKWVRRFVISEIDHHKRGFTIYKVTSIISHKCSPEVVSKVSVWKRYSDFRKLHAALSTVYSTLQRDEPYPTFPKPRFFGRFEAEVIGERRDCAVKLLTFIAGIPALYSSDSFIKFFESSHLDGHSVGCSISLSSDTSDDDRILAKENQNQLQQSDKNAQSFVRGFRKFIRAGQTRHTLPSRNNQIKHQNYEKEEAVIDNRIRSNYNGTNNSENFSNVIRNTKEELVARREEKISIHDGSDLPKESSDTAQYILIAAAHMSTAFRHEAITEYEEAFTQYKLGISNLMNGIQTDPDIERRIMIKRKIRKYLERAEKLYNRHLNCNVSILNKPVSELSNFKVLAVLDSVMLVKDILRGFTRIIKTIEMPEKSNDNISNYILRGKVPYMVQLYGCIQTESTVFLILQYIRRGKLWNFIKSNCDQLIEKSQMCKNTHTRSLSCDAVMQLNYDKEHRYPYILKREVECDKIEERERNVGNLEIVERENKSQRANFRIDIEIDKESKLALDSNQSDIHTMQLLANAQKLLLSVNNILKKSNSLSVSLNKSQQMLHETENGIKNVEIFQSSDKRSKDKYCDMSYLKLERELNSNECSLSSRFDINPEFHLSTINDRKSTQNECNDVEIYGSIGDEGGIYKDKLIETKVEVGYSEDEQEPSWRIPKSIITCWAAQILVAIESLHQQDTIIADLRPDNILISDDGACIITYIVRHRDLNLFKFEEPYSAPELCAFIPPITATPAVDIWSYGVLLYELLTGFKFQIKHPGRFNSHSVISIPKGLSLDAESLLTSILKYRPNERLTIPEIKRHPFFARVDWLKFLNS